MHQHPIPRQITTFEFKLIGFMTLRQFIYLLVFTFIAIPVYFITPIPYVDILLAVFVMLIGAAFAFLPIQDKPLEEWIKNLWKRLQNPTQFYYHKHNDPLYFLQDLYYLGNPHFFLTHIESKEKLAAYLSQRKKARPKLDQKRNMRQQQIQKLTQSSREDLSGQKRVPQFHVETIEYEKEKQFVDTLLHESSAQIQEELQGHPQPMVVHSADQPQPQKRMPFTAPHEKPFLTGIVKTHRGIPIPGILIYIHNQQQQPVRLLKTNHHGVFATFKPFPSGNYDILLRDPAGTYNFDTMNTSIHDVNTKPLEFHSKEIL